MRNSRNHILTSHVGSLPRPDDLIEANRKRDAGEGMDETAFQGLLQEAVTDVVRRQKNTGIDVPGDGEFGKSMGHKVNYGAWFSYAFNRLTGLERTSAEVPNVLPRKAHPDELVLLGILKRRDRVRFAAAYADPDSGISIGRQPLFRPICVGPVKYVGQDAIKADIAHFKTALAACGVSEGFMSSVAPGSISRLGNTYYKTDEEFMFACADAMREEYKAIVDAGLVLQLDDPGIAENWDQIDPAPSVAAYKISPCGASRRLITRSKACRRIASVFICAGAVGTGRTRLTCQCATSST